MHPFSDTAEQVASYLLDLEAVRLSPEKPFHWASGWHSPIYCDNRLILSYPHARTFIKEGLLDLMKVHFPDAEGVAGVATAGIPHAALIADGATLPMLYVRSAPKEHGMGNQIEGKITPGQRVVVIEDLVSTGGSSLKVCQALQLAGLEVLGLIAVFSYGFAQAEDAFAAKGIPLVSLTDYETLVRVAADKKIVQDEQISILTEWRKSPSTWGR